MTAKKKENYMNSFTGTIDTDNYLLDFLDLKTLKNLLLTNRYFYKLIKKLSFYQYLIPYANFNNLYESGNLKIIKKLKLNFHQQNIFIKKACRKGFYHVVKWFLKDVYIEKIRHESGGCFHWEYYDDGMCDGYCYSYTPYCCGLEDIKKNFEKYIIKANKYNNTDIIKFLVKHSKNIICDKFILDQACRKGDLKLVKFLINSNFRISKIAIYLALINNHTQIIDFLLKNNATFKLDKVIDIVYGIIISEKACEQGSFSCIKLLFDFDMKISDYALYNAIAYRHSDIAEFLYFKKTGNKIPNNFYDVDIYEIDFDTSFYYYDEKGNYYYFNNDSNNDHNDYLDDYYDDHNCYNNS